MEGMINEAKRHVGNWNFAFQNALCRWLVNEVQPKLDRLVQLEEQERSRLQDQAPPPSAPASGSARDSRKAPKTAKGGK